MRFFAFLFGIFFLLFGIAMLIPPLTPEGELFGVFRVNAWLSVVHLITGIFGIVAGFAKRPPLRLYFQIVGVVYGLFAVQGFIYGDKEILGVFTSSAPNTWLYVIVSVVALILGFGSND